MLSKGSYYLVVRNDKAERGTKNRKGAPITFSLDVMRLQSSISDNREFIEAMELCPLPDSPSGGFNRIGYLHTLSGASMQSNMLFKIIELDSGKSISFKVDDTSLVNAYIEVPSDFEVALSIREAGGLKKVMALSSDQDSTTSNFLKQKGFTERNVVSLRTVLRPGTYHLELQADSFEDATIDFDHKQNMCETYQLSLSVNPTKSASVPYFQSDQEEHCLSTQTLPSKLE